MLSSTLIGCPSICLWGAYYPSLQLSESHSSLPPLPTVIALMIIETPRLLVVNRCRLSFTASRTLSFTNQGLWQPFLGSTMAWGIESPLNILLILVSLSPVHSWWPYWMVCSLRHNPLVGFLASHDIYTLACPLPWAFLSLSPLSFIAIQALQFHSTRAITFSTLLKATIAANLHHPLGSLPRVKFISWKNVSVNKVSFI